jgi:predicted neuraminidase
LTNFKVSSRYEEAGPPIWEREGLVLLKPDDFKEEALRLMEPWLSTLRPVLSDRQKQSMETLKQRLGDKLYQRLGWQPRCKPTALPSGRILLPLYTDTFSFSIMAVSDDDGETWYASKPLLGFGNIQPSVLRRENGTLVAYMRENGPQKRIRTCESPDSGLSWGAVGAASLPNPGSGLDGLQLANGHWLLVYNDTTSGRNSLAVSLSEDEGRSWKWTRHLERHKEGSYHYPAMIQGRDGRIHVVYSYFVAGGKSMKHAAFEEDWIRQSD